MQFADRLVAAVKRSGNPILVGIDPRLEDLPTGFIEKFSADRKGIGQAYFQFGCDVIDTIASLIPAVKFQAAFYEAYGPEGVEALHRTARYARERGLIAIFDGKRNDIGSTADAYARAYLGKVSVGQTLESSWDFDAMTVNPYLGSDGIMPFVKAAAEENKGVFVLVRTSNPSAGEFQDLVAQGRPLYRHVAERLSGWGASQRGTCGYSLLGAVVGATYPGELAELREALPGVIFLVPGYGTQGGSGKDVAAAFDQDGLGAIVNSSRGLTFAYQRPAFARHASNWQRAIEEAVLEMRDDLAINTNAGKLR